MQSTPFDIPDQMRQMADKSVDQAKKAFDDFMKATQDAVAKAEGSAKTVRDGTADMNRQALAYLEQNLTESFELAQKLVRASSIEEVAALQQEYLRRQMAAASEQGKGLSDMLGRATGDVIKKTRI
jgi:phasin